MLNNSLNPSENLDWTSEKNIGVSFDVLDTYNLEWIKEYISNFNIKEKLEIIINILEENKHKNLSITLRYILKDEIVLYSEKEINDLIDFVNSSDKRKKFELIRTLWMILNYNNLRFKEQTEKSGDNFIKFLTLWQKQIEIFYQKLSEICDNPFLEITNSLNFVWIYEQLNDKIDTGRITKSYSKYKIQWNNSETKWNKYGSRLRVSSDFISHSFEMKSQWIIQSNISEDTCLSEEEEVDNDSFRLYDNIFDIYVWEKYDITDIHKLEDKKQYQQIDKEFDLSKYSNEFLLKIIFYINDDQSKNFSRVQGVLSNIFW